MTQSSFFGALSDTLSYFLESIWWGGTSIKRNFETYLSDILRYSDFLGHSSCFWPDFKVTGLSLAKEWPGLWSLMWLGTTCSRLQSLALFLSHSLPKLGLGWSSILLSSKEGMGPKRRRDTTNTPQGRRVTDPVQDDLIKCFLLQDSEGPFRITFSYDHLFTPSSTFSGLLARRYFVLTC